MARPTSGIVGLLKQAAALIGAKTVGVVYVGMAAKEREQALKAGTVKKARKLGRKLVG